MDAPVYDFLKQAGRILNSGQSRSITLTGNIQDLFFATGAGYVPLIDLLCRHWRVANRVLLVYELNGPIRFVEPKDLATVREAWTRWRTVAMRAGQARFSWDGLEGTGRAGGRSATSPPYLRTRPA